MSLKIRRVVTGHDNQGRAKVLVDEQVGNVISMRPGANSSPRPASRWHFQQLQSFYSSALS